MRGRNSLRRLHDALFLHLHLGRHLVLSQPLLYHFAPAPRRVGVHRARPRLVELITIAHALRQPPPLGARVALRPELFVQPGRGRGGCTLHRLCLGLGHRRDGYKGGCVGGGSGCGRRGQAVAEARLRLELEVPRNLGMRAEALTAPVKEVLVGIAGGVAPAPDLDPSAPAVDHVARAATALEVRCEQADPFVLAAADGLELEVSRDLRMRAKAPAAWVEEVVVGLAVPVSCAGGVAPAPDLGLSAPAVDHVARAAAAYEVRSERADQFVHAPLVLLVRVLVLNHLAPAHRGVGVHRARPRLVELVTVAHALRQPPPLSTGVALRP
eukprot:scaffold38950_cov68-Phaeocystis_antarctica.AAC.6